MLARVFVAAAALCASSLAQEAAAPAAEEPAAAGAAPEQPIQCPVMGGGFDDRYAVAQLLIMQRNLPQAEVCLLEAMQSTFGALSLLSDLSAAMSMANRAAAFSQILSQLNPNDGETIFLHAQRLSQAGRWDESKPLLTRLREANEANPAIANSLGAAHYNTFDYEAAKLEFAHALSLAPNNTDFAANLDKATKVAAGEETHDGTPKEGAADAAAPAEGA